MIVIPNPGLCFEEPYICGSNHLQVVATTDGNTLANYVHKQRSAKAGVLGRKLSRSEWSSALRVFSGRSEGASAWPIRKHPEPLWGLYYLLVLRKLGLFCTSAIET